MIVQIIKPVHLVLCAYYLSFQGYVYNACEMCKKAIAMVNKLQVFSENEDIEEVSSIEIK